MQIINYPETWIIVSLDDPIFYLKYRYEMYVINEIPISQRVLNNFIREIMFSIIITQQTGKEE